MSDSAARRGFFLLEMLPELCLIGVISCGCAVFISLALSNPTVSQHLAGGEANTESKFSSSDRHSDAIYDLELLPDGDLVVSSFCASVVRMSPHGRPRWTRPRDELANIVRFASSPSGPRILLTGRSGEVYLSDEMHGTEKRILIGSHSALVTSAAMSRNGEFAATGATDGEVRLWDLNAGKCSRILATPESPVPGSLQILAFSPDGRMVARSDEEGISFYLLPAGERVGQIARPKSAERPISLAFTPNGKFLAEGSIDGQVKLWRMSDQSLVWKDSDVSLTVLSLEFTPNGSFLLAGFLNGELRVYSADSGLVEGSWSAHNRGIRVIRSTADGKSFYTAGYDGHIRRWDMRTMSEDYTLR